MEILAFIKLIFIGIILGITTVIPGLSAGTMAVVLNVYNRLIEVIVPNVKKIISSWSFWLPLVVGGIAGIFLFSKLVTVLYENYPIPTNWFFIGVITGSIPLIYDRIKKPSSVFPHVSSVICAFLALVVMIVMAIVKPEDAAAVYTELSLQVFIFIALGGVFSAIAMLVPGISGAFLLLVIGLYQTVLKAVSDLNIFLLVPFMLGAAAGLLAGAALIRLLLAKAPHQTYGAVLGLVAGSVLVLYPGGFGSGNAMLASIMCFTVGAILSFFFGRQKS